MDVGLSSSDPEVPGDLIWKDYMSHTTIYASTCDMELVNRIRAALGQEAYNNEALSQTPTGQAIIAAGHPDVMLAHFVWPICIDNRLAYAYAIESGNPSPGGDRTVITDEALTSGVQAHWPDPVVAHTLPDTGEPPITEPLPASDEPSHNVQS